MLVELDDVDDLVSLNEASRIVGLHPTPLQRAVEAHTIASTVRNGKRLVSLADVRAWRREPILS